MLRTATALRGRAARATSRWRATSAGAPAAAPTARTCPRTSTTCGVPARAARRTSRCCFVGLGSNLLVRDGGLRGTVVLHARASHGAIARGRRRGLRRGRRGEPEGGALRRDARTRGRRVPRRHSRHRRRRAGDERRLLRRRDLGRRAQVVDHRPRAASCTRAARDDFEIGYRHVALRRRRAGRGRVVRRAPGSRFARGDGAALARDASRSCSRRRIAIAAARPAQRRLGVPQSAGRPRRAPDRGVRAEGLSRSAARGSRRSTPTSSSTRRARHAPPTSRR